MLATLGGPSCFVTDSWWGFIRSAPASRHLHLALQRRCGSHKLVPAQEGVNSLREIVRLGSLEVGSASSKRPNLMAVAESLQSAIESTASGAVALRSSCLGPLIEEARSCQGDQANALLYFCFVSPLILLIILIDGECFACSRQTVEYSNIRKFKASNSCEYCVLFIFYFSLGC